MEEGSISASCCGAAVLFWPVCTALFGLCAHNTFEKEHPL